MVISADDFRTKRSHTNEARVQSASLSRVSHKRCSKQKTSRLSKFLRKNYGNTTSKLERNTMRGRKEDESMRATLLK